MIPINLDQVLVQILFLKITKIARSNLQQIGPLVIGLLL